MYVQPHLQGEIIVVSIQMRVEWNGPLRFCPGRTQRCEPCFLVRLLCGHRLLHWVLGASMCPLAQLQGSLCPSL